MRPLGLAVALLLLAVPLASAADPDLIYRLELRAARGAQSGPILFTLDEDHRLSGMAIGMCGGSTLGTLRILTPSGGWLEATIEPRSCSVGMASFVGDASLPAGDYRGAYAFNTGFAVLVEFFGERI